MVVASQQLGCFGEHLVGFFVQIRDGDPCSEFPVVRVCSDEVGGRFGGKFIKFHGGHAFVHALAHLQREF